MEFVLVLGLAAGYFLPAIIAMARNHRNAGAIILLNLLLGWTLIGWVAAILWSVSYQPPAADKAAS